MGKIGDLWVKLGLKKEEFSRGIKEAGNEGQGFAERMRHIGTAVKAAWAAVGAAVVKFATDAVKMTQRWGDQWEATMQGISAAYGAFVRQISSGEGWRNLFSNMREAARLAKEAATAMDELGERKVGYNYTAAETEREIAAQQLIMRDASKSDAERQAAARRIIELERQLGDEKKSIAQQEADAMRKRFQAQTRMNDDEIDFLIRRYNENRDAIQQSRDYLAERLRLEKEIDAAARSYGTGTMSSAAYESIARRRQDAEKALADLEGNTSQYIKDIAVLTQKYDKGNDELVQGMARAEVAVIEVDTAVMQAQTRATALLGSLSKASGNVSAGVGVSFEIGAADMALIRANERIEDELARQMQQIEREVEAMDKIEFAPLEIVPPDMTDFDRFYSNFKARQEALMEVVENLRTAVVDGFSAAAETLMDQFAGLEEINPGKVVQALLTPLADMAIKEGEILMAEGIGVEACKKALEELNGPVAIAAGAALVAIGAAAKSGLAALAKSGAGSTATTTYSGAGASSAAQTQTIQTEMTVYVTGRLSGSDILLSGKKTQSNWNR